MAAACGSEFTAVVTRDGSILTFGRGGGHLGRVGVSGPKPERVRCLGVCVIAVACGDAHTMARTASGELWGWGRGGDGQLGSGLGESTVLPHRVHFEAETGGSNGSESAVACVLDVACGAAHTVALVDSGQVFSWGRGGPWLGLKDGETRLQPTPMCLSQSNQDIALRTATSVAAGRWHTVALTAVDDDTWQLRSCGRLLMERQQNAGRHSASQQPWVLTDVGECLTTKHPPLIACGGRSFPLVCTLSDNSGEDKLLCWKTSGAGAPTAAVSLAVADVKVSITQPLLLTAFPVAVTVGPYAVRRLSAADHFVACVC